MANKVTNYITFRGEKVIIKRVINQISNGELFQDEIGAKVVSDQVAASIERKSMHYDIYSETETYIKMYFMTNWNGIPFEVEELAKEISSIVVEYAWINPMDGNSCSYEYIEGVLTCRNYEEFGHDWRGSDDTSDEENVVNDESVDIYSIDILNLDDDSF